jgi:hypothetical protein
MRRLRIDGETDDEFRVRAERVGRIARVLIEACLVNRQIQAMMAEGRITEATIRAAPIVRVEFEQAIAIGGIGETLAATASKHWGAGPSILPLEVEDVFFEDRITYIYRANSLYNPRFEQRQRMKELLGRTHRKLVGEAKYHTKAFFLERLTADQAQAIHRVFGIEPGVFWRACHGTLVLNLPPRPVQLELPFDEE